MSIASIASGRIPTSEDFKSHSTVPKNPVVGSARYVYERTDLVKLSSSAILEAARYINDRLISETYTPWSWRDHALHLCPPEQYSPHDPRTRNTLDWLFLVSSLNFSFWSEYEDQSERFGIEWRAGWKDEERKVWTGYWSLVAALDRALEAGIPITDPSFYSSEERCPDSLIENIFKPAPGCKEGVPLLCERIKIMRENGAILCKRFGGSFQGLLDDFLSKHNGRGSALQLVEMITETFPSFRDEVRYDGRRVMFWKRAQIMVAETWAAFHPVPAGPEPADARNTNARDVSNSTLGAHPFFPSGVGQLTMFADYRVPQILHHLRILEYPPTLVRTLEGHVPVPHGSREELSIRAASILAVEEIRRQMALMLEEDAESAKAVRERGVDVSSVVIDFYLWDFAKRIEAGEDSVKGIQTQPILPAHRTRSIWY